MNVPRHADMAAFAWVIPFDGDACKFIAGHVELYSMVLPENIKEIVEVFDPHIFNPEIINDKDELDGTPFVAPKSWCGDCLVEAFFDKTGAQ